MDSSTGTIASIIIDFIVVVQVERGWFFRLILIMIILILTKILIRLIDSSIKSGLGIRHQHCLFICRVSVKKDKFHKFMKILSKNLHTEHSTTSGQRPRSSSCIFLASHSLSQRSLFGILCTFQSFCEGSVGCDCKRWVTFICECVRSIINYQPQNQDVDINMFETFF